MKEHDYIDANYHYRRILQKVPRSQIVIGTVESLLFQLENYGTDFQPKKANYGLSFYRIQKHDEALKCFKKALKMNPKCPTSQFYTALIKFDVGNYEECLHDLKKLDDMYPKGIDFTDL